ncbi:hypothetical protein LZC95_49255 [Pendulispora brunnea]|uniref:GNAT family N-acetyltransferase n=1 Tax=Pendulispora brunnea TaxID=2905690 RepID=A0ABZ2K6W4_9BACT
MQFDTLTIRRVVGAQSLEDAFVRRVHDTTERAMEANLPLRETLARLGRANRAHYIYLASAGREELVGYALNEIYHANVASRGAVKVNYFCSAFLLREVRRRYSMYRMLGPMRLAGDERVLMIRTQSPLPMAGFRRLCRAENFHMYSPLDGDVPAIVPDVVVNRFGGPELVHRAAYPTRVSPPHEPHDAQTARLMRLIEPERGDALVLIGVANELLLAHSPNCAN